ncbi:MAG: hypothetical protein R2774_12920 [Saprospiraceae bacterium]
MRSFIIVLLTFASIMVCHSQIEFGIKGGLSTKIGSSENFFKDDLYSKAFWTNGTYGHHLGIYTRLSVAFLYVEPSILFNSDKITYTIDDYTEGSLYNTIIEDTYKSIDVPVVAGLKFGIFRLKGGVTGHIPISSIRDVLDVTDYDVTFSKGKFAWLAGAGLDLWRLRLDVQYEGKLASQSDYVTIGGNDYYFDQGNPMVSATLGFRF